MKRYLVLLVGVQAVHSAVVTNSNVWLSPGGFIWTTTGSAIADYALTIEQYPPPGASPTSIFFDRIGENLIYRAMNLDGGSFWYFAMLNDQFTPNTIDQFTPFNQPYQTEGQSFSVPYGDFYMGVRTYSDFGENIQGFGWAKMNNSVSGLTLLGSAITYDQPGIVIGTTTTIPEAGTLLLLMPAVTLSALVRRRRMGRHTALGSSHCLPLRS